MKVLIFVCNESYYVGVIGTKVDITLITVQRNIWLT